MLYLDYSYGDQILGVSRDQILGVWIRFEGIMYVGSVFKKGGVTFFIIGKEFKTYTALVTIDDTPDTHYVLEYPSEYMASLSASGYLVVA